MIRLTNRIFKSLKYRIKRKFNNGSSYEDYYIQQIDPIKPIKSENPKIRINLIITSMNKQNVYVGF